MEVDDVPLTEEGCPVCLVLPLTEPIKLNCGHILCWPCHFTWSYSLWPVPPNCTVCRQETTSVCQVHDLPSGPRVSCVGDVQIPPWPVDDSWKISLGHQTTSHGLNLRSRRREIAVTPPHDSSDSDEWEPPSELETSSSEELPDPNESPRTNTVSPSPLRSQTSMSQSVSRKTRCAICLEDDDNLTEPCRLGCHHTFCWPCIYQNVEASGTDICPICRRCIVEIFPVTTCGISRITGEYLNIPSRPETGEDPFADLRMSAPTNADGSGPSQAASAIGASSVSPSPTVTSSRGTSSPTVTSSRGTTSQTATSTMGRLPSTANSSRARFVAPLRNPRNNSNHLPGFTGKVQSSSPAAFGNFPQRSPRPPPPPSRPSPSPFRPSLSPFRPSPSSSPSPSASRPSPSTSSSPSSRPHPFSSCPLPPSSCPPPPPFRFGRPKSSTPFPAFPLSITNSRTGRPVGSIVDALNGGEHEMENADDLDEEHGGVSDDGERGQNASQGSRFKATELFPGTESTYLEVMSEILRDKQRESPTVFGAINWKVSVLEARSKNADSFPNKSEKDAAKNIQKMLTSAKKAFEGNKRIIPKVSKAGTARENAMFLIWREISELMGRPGAIKKKQYLRGARMGSSTVVQARRRPLPPGPSVGLIAQPHLVISQPNPVMSQPNPVMSQPNPVMSQPNQVMSQPNQVMSRSNQVMSRSNPLMSQSNLVMSRSNPVMSQSNPFMSQSNPVMSQSNPVMSQSNPVMSESNPVMSQDNPVISQHNPIMSQPDTVMSTMNTQPQTSDHQFHTAAADYGVGDQQGTELRERAVGNMRQRRNVQTRVMGQMNNLNSNIEALSSSRNQMAAQSGNLLEGLDRRAEARAAAREEEKEERRRREERDREESIQYRQQMNLMFLAAISRNTLPTQEIQNIVQPREIKLFKIVDPEEWPTSSPDFPVTIKLTTMVELKQELAEYYDEQLTAPAGIVFQNKNGDKSIITAVDQIKAESGNVTIQFKGLKKYYVITER